MAAFEGDCRGCAGGGGRNVNIRPTGELDHAKTSLSVVLGFLGARGAVVISAVFQAFLRDWLWVFVSRGVGMSLADGVTGVVLADGGGGWKRGPHAGPLAAPGGPYSANTYAAIV